MSCSPAGIRLVKQFTVETVDVNTNPDNAQLMAKSAVPVTKKTILLEYVKPVLCGTRGRDASANNHEALIIIDASTDNHGALIRGKFTM